MSMEKERFSSNKSLKNPAVIDQGKEEIERERSKRMTFKSKAKQVWMANLIAKQRTTQTKMKIQENNETIENNVLLSTAHGVTRPPNVKRKGTPDIFPMSSEMKKTLLLLGNLDLLPEEEREPQQTDLSEGEAKTPLSKFRLKTKQKIIQPQRFLRGMRASGPVNKQSPMKKETLSDDNMRTTDDLIDSEAGKLDESKQEEISIESKKNTNLSGEDEDNKRGRQMKNTRVFSQSFHPVKRNAWSKSLQKYQAVYVMTNSSSKTNRGLDSKIPSRKYHLSCKTLQPDADFERIHYPPMRRAISVENTTNTENDSTDINDDIRDGKTINEITADIQLRCSKWFEFRQKILKQRDIKRKRESYE